MNVNNNPYHQVYEELPQWYIEKQKEEEAKKNEEKAQLEFNIPFGWTE